MLVGRFKTYRKKESFGSLFFGLIFLPGFSSLLDPKRKGSQSDHSVTFALSDSSPGMQRCIPGWGILERKGAEVRRATTSLLLHQGSNFLIRRCKALRQTSTHQESFSLRGQNKGAEVVGRTKLADQTTFKQI